jgi:hypothetical protein
MSNRHTQMGFPSLASLLVSLPVWALSGVLSASCTRQGSFQAASGGPVAASHPLGVNCPAVSLSDVPDGGSKSVACTSSNVATQSSPKNITVLRRGSRLFYTAQGVYTASGYAELEGRLAERPDAEKRQTHQQEMDNILGKVSAIGGIPLRSEPSLGYFSVLLPYDATLFATLDPVQFDIPLLVEAVVLDPNPIARERALAPNMLGEALGAAVQGGSDSNGAFSGLGPIGAVEFAAQAEKDIGGGARVDGSSVRIGITDTGITYNHPTFRSSLDPSKNRIAYINDSTGEGTVYINSQASFVATAPSGGSAEDLMIDAQVIKTPILPALPAGDDFTLVQGLKAKVSPELRAILLDPSSGARLGILSEIDLQGGESPVDLAHDGKLNDQFYMIYLPAANGKPERVYFDPTGTADFRASPALANFNQPDGSHPTQDVFAEKLGFTFTSSVLPSKDGKSKTPLTAIAFVGFDEGDHGTHVSGIAAGSRTIQNDPAGAQALARGVAPEATLAVNRICSNNSGCGGSDGIVDLAMNAGVQVINMSLGGLSLFNDGIGVEETLINRVTSTKNILFVISAGNDGPGRQTIGSPSSARLSISVGATASNALIARQYEWSSQGVSGISGASGATGATGDFMLFFSSRGPLASGGFKPNLTAPGTELSSLPLNAAPGQRGGLDVYWGTSMAAPTTTGGYALLLDGIQKYNIAHPGTPLATDAMTLRRVLIETARPFDITRVNSSSNLPGGEKTTGQYTWLDEGAGMLNLPAAWQKLFEVRDGMPVSAVSLNGKSIELDYALLVSETTPNGSSYDGSRIDGDSGQPIFGAGLYLSAGDPETLKHVNVVRQLPELYASSTDSADLTRQLLTTADEFVLKTYYDGDGDSWLKVGVRDQLDCSASDTSNLFVIGGGTAVQLASGGAKGTLNPTNASVLNICVNRDLVRALKPGDHGALIYAYRVAGGKTAPIASFIVPISLSVPAQVLSGSTAFDMTGDVKSFGLGRNYVQVPAGTSVLRLTVEVPLMKTDADGGVADGQHCSGIQFLGYGGQNTSPLFTDTLHQRIANCSQAGAPTNTVAARVLSLTQENPQAGLWDLHVFGQYRYPDSQYHLRVDYVTGTTSIGAIQGNATALQGNLTWTLVGSSLKAQPDATQSVLELTGLQAKTSSVVAQDQNDYVASPLGVLRHYPEGVRSVTISTGGSPDNDIDLRVLSCPLDATLPTDPRCKQIGISDGPTDVEHVTFTPAEALKYVAVVDGSTVKDAGGAQYVTTEALTYATELGTVTVSGAGPDYAIGYAFPVPTSSLLKLPLFTGGTYSAVGDLTLKMSDGTALSAVPVQIQAK